MVVKRQYDNTRLDPFNRSVKQKTNDFYRNDYSTRLQAAATPTKTVGLQKKSVPWANNDDQMIDKFQTSTPNYYTVKPGDTLSGIASSNGLDWRELQKSNGIGDPRKLQIGTKLNLGGGVNGKERWYDDQIAKPPVDNTPTKPNIPTPNFEPTTTAKDYVSGGNQTTQPTTGVSEEPPVAQSGSDYMSQMREILASANQGTSQTDQMLTDYMGSMKEILSGGGQSQGPDLPDQINLDKYKTDSATIEDLKSKYGFDYSRDNAQAIAEAEAQAKRDAVQTQRDSAQSNNQLAQDSVQENYFQRYLAQQQELVNSGLNAGLEADANTRLGMNQQNAMGQLMADYANRMNELDRNSSRIGTEQVAREAQIGNQYAQQAADLIGRENSFRQSENQAQLSAAMRQNEMATNNAWRDYEFNNLSAGEKAQLANNSQQFAMRMAQQNEQFNNMSQSQKANFLQRAAEYADQQQWREYTFENMSASEKATMKRLEEQYGTDMAYKIWKEETDRLIDEGQNGNFNQGAGSNGNGLGSLSQQYESNGNPGAYGYDSTGGASYGTYQIATNTGTMDNFLSYLKNSSPKYATALGMYKPGTQQFTSIWKQLAEDNPEEFAKVQHDFIGSTHYKPAATRIQSELGLSFDNPVLQDVLWSTAVQHGPTGAYRIYKNAGIKPNMNPQEVIKKIYQERAANNGNKYFPSSTNQVRNSVVNRFGKEMQNALNMLG